MVKISVVVTSYNYERFLEQCIVSCLDQKGCSDFEVIVVDDGSTDGTRAILEKYAGRIRAFVNPNMGIEGASNFGIDRAEGKYVVRVDADDKLGPDYLRIMSDALDRSSCAFAYSEYFSINGADSILGEKKLPEFNVDEIRARGDFLATGTLYRKEVLLDMGKYNTATRNCGLENYELILKMLEHGHSGVRIASPLFCYRQHTANVSLTRRDAIIAYGQELAKRFGLDKYSVNENHPWGLIL